MPYDLIYVAWRSQVRLKEGLAVISWYCKAIVLIANLCLKAL